MMKFPVMGFPEEELPDAAPTVEPPPVAPPEPGVPAGTVPPMLARPEEPAPMPAPMPAPAPAPVRSGAPSGAGNAVPSQLAKLNASQREAAIAEATREGKVAGATVKGADAEVTAREGSQEQRESIYGKAQADFDQKQKMLAAEDEKYKRMGYRDFWSDKSTGQKVTAMLSVALGGLGDAFSARGGNRTNFSQQAMGNINTLIERDMQVQREMMEKQLKVVERAGGDVNAARARMDLTLDNKEKNAFELVAARGRQMVAAAGVPPADVNKHPLVVAADRAAYERDQAMKEQAAKLSLMRAQTEETRAQAAEHRAAAVAKAATDGPGGRAAGIQIQKATLAEHASTALDTIEELHKKGVQLTEKDREMVQNNIMGIKGAEHDPLRGWILRGVGILPRQAFQGLSGDKQRLANAYDILAQKGAGITSPSHAEDEMKHARSMFDMLEPGITPDLMAQKLDYARGIVGAAKGLGGKYTGIAAQGAAAERSARGDAGGAAPSGAPPGGRRFQTAAGQTGWLTADGMFHADSAVAAR